MKRRFADLAVAAVILGIAQALVETLVLAWLHRGLLLAPYRYFPTHAYDAFAKTYFFLAGHVHLPLLLDDFVAQGFVPKLALAPQLVAINMAVALLAAAILAPAAGLVGVGRGGLRRALGVVAAASILVHALEWAAGFQAPEFVTAFKLGRAVLRDFLQGGAGLALAVLAVSALLSRLLLASRPAVQATVAAGAAAALFALVPSAPDAGAKVEAASRSVAASPASGYNVVLISIDSLRADHLGAYGYQRPTSPNLDAVARGGVLFRHGISTTSWTLPAHMSLLTARSLLGHGVVSDDRSLPASVGTVAEVFANGGYETHAIVSAPYLNSRYGFARGFDDYDDRTIHFETNEDSYRSVTAPALVSATKAFLGGPHDKPFFLFLHFWDVHYDYAPGAPYDTMFDPDYKGTVDGNNFYFDPKINKDMARRDLDHLVALYDGEIRLVDDHIGAIRSELARLGISGRTILAVVGDHCDEFFEHGNKGHHRTLYEESVRIPMLLEVPGRSPSLAVVEEEASLIDVAPTLLGLAGLASPPGAEGRDFSGLYTGSSLPARSAVFAELYRTGTRNVQVAEIDARRKIIHHFQRRSLEAFDLAVDPAEMNSLAAVPAFLSGPVAGLAAWIDPHWHRFDKRLRSEGINPVILDAKAKEQLRSLGYLQ